MVSVRNGRVCSSDGPSARAAGRRFCERRPENGGHAVGLGERALRRAERRRQLGQRRAEVGLLAGERREHDVRALHELGQLGVLGAQRLHHQREVVDGALEVPAPEGEQLVRPARVARGRLDPADRLGERAAVALQRGRPVAEQQRQVVARVGVQRRQHLVEVDVGQRLRDRDPLALRQLPGRLGARRQLGHHVLQAGLRAQEDGRVAIDRRVLALDLHPHDRLAVLQLDARDLAHLDAGDVHRLALARRDRLRRGELGLDRDDVLAQERHAGRQREPLVGEDHQRHDQRDDQQDDDRHGVTEVLADREAHQRIPVFVPNGRSFLRSSGSLCLAASAAPPTGGVKRAAGPLRFGSVCL